VGQAGTHERTVASVSARMPPARSRGGTLVGLRTIVALAFALPAFAAPPSFVCPVTLPSQTFAQYGTFANAFLGTNPGRDGVLRPPWSEEAEAKESSLPANGPLTVDLTWWRWRPGALVVTGRRLDAAAPPLRATIVSGHGDAGFQPTVLQFPSSGCWEITGRVADGSLTFVSRVEATAAPQPERQRLQFYMPYRPDDRALELRPRRRDAPLRELNISDDEVREVQAAFGANVRPEMLNIAGVVTGCPCEDGSGCAEQVWVEVAGRSASRGYLLSRVDGHWTIGPVQRWWLRWQLLEANAKKLGWQEYTKAVARLNAEFPACSADSKTVR
jgi:hypothetical protein